MTPEIETQKLVKGNEYFIRLVHPQTKLVRATYRGHAEASPKNLEYDIFSRGEEFILVPYGTTVIKDGVITHLPHFSDSIVHGKITQKNRSDMAEILAQAGVKI